MERVFLAHPKDETPNDAEQAALRQCLVALGMPGAGDPCAVEFITGESDFHANAQRYGGWAGWPSSVATGKEYRGNIIAPRFDYIVVLPRPTIGKGTADIIRAALEVQKPIFFFDGKRIARVQRIVYNGGDFRNGWSIG